MIAYIRIKIKKYNYEHIGEDAFWSNVTTLFLNSN